MPVYRRERALIVTFAGLGIDGALKTTCLPISTSTSALQPFVSVFPDAYRALISRDNGIPVIDVANQSVSPVRGDPQQGDLLVEIVIPDSEVELARYFAAVAARPVAYATQDFLPTQTVIQVGPGEVASSGIVSNSIIYWGREAFRVESVDTGADTITVVDETANGTRTVDGAVGVEGQFGTYIENHYGEQAGQQPPYNDSRIFLQNPFLKDREVVVWQSNAGLTPETKQSRYYLESVTWTNNQTSLEIRCRDVLAVVADQQVNSNVARYDAQMGHAARWPVPHPETTTDLSVAIRQMGIEYSLLARNEGSLFKIGELILWATVSDEWVVNDALEYGSGFLFLGDGVRQQAINGGPLPTAIDTSGSVEELISSNPAFYLPNRAGGSTSPYYSSTLGTEAIHPLDILRCHLGLIDSQLPGSWISILPVSDVDDEEIVRLRDTVYQGWTWLGLIQVCDGSSVGLLEWLTEKILRPLMASFTVDEGGRLTVRSILDLADTSLPEIDDEYILAGRAVGFDLEVGVDAIKASTAYRANGKPSISIFGTGAYQSRFTLTRDPQIVDLPAEGLISISEDASVYSAVVQRYSERLARLASLFRMRAQTVKLSILMEAQAQAGQYRLMRVRGLRDPATGLTTTDPEQRLGYITAVENDPRTGVAKITAILYPSLLKRIGPSAVVIEKIDDIEFKIAVDEYISPVETSGPYIGGYPYAPSSGGVVYADGQTFLAGDRVVIRDKYLARVSGIAAAVVSSYNVGTQIMKLVAPGFSGYGPNVDDVLTYADDDELTAIDDFAYFIVDAYVI
jgi:hypothetical protein